MGSVFGPVGATLGGQEVVKIGLKRRPKASDAEKAPPVKRCTASRRASFLALEGQRWGLVEAQEASSGRPIPAKIQVQNITKKSLDFSSKSALKIAPERDHSWL